MTPHRRSPAPLLAVALLLAGCASSPPPGEIPCPRPEVEAEQIFGLPETFEPGTLEGRWRLSVVTSSGVETARMAVTPLVLVPSPDSLYMHPLCMQGDACTAAYPLRGWIENRVEVGAVRVEPTSPDPERPGIVVEWTPELREAVLMFGNPPVRGRLGLDVGSYFTVVIAEPDRFVGFWTGGGLGSYVTPDGRNLGGLGGWFCAERTG